MKSIIRRIGLALMLGVTIAVMAGCSGSGVSRLRQTPPVSEATQLLADVHFAAAVANAMDRIRCIIHPYATGSARRAAISRAHQLPWS